MAIAICGNTLQSVATDSNLWEHIRMCGSGLQSVAPLHFQVCGNIIEPVTIDIQANLWPQIRICERGNELLSH